MDIGQIRRANMLVLIDRFATQAKFADAVGKPASYISQIKRGKKPNGDTVSMGSDFARDIENSLELPHGWMDRIGESGTAEAATTGIDVRGVEHPLIGGATAHELVDIEYMDIKASCGGGYVNDEHAEKIKQPVTVEFLRDNDLPTNGKGVVMMHACSDSMGDTVPHGSSLIVDTNDKSFDSFINNKVYVFDADGEMICKRAVKSLNGDVVLKSDNHDKDKYPDQVITRSTFNNFKLFGRVSLAITKL